MNRLWRLLLLGLVVAAVGCDAAPDWQTFTSRDGNYSVNFPGPAQEAATPPMGFTAVCAGPDGTAYQVKYTDLPMHEDMLRDPRAVDQTLGGIAVRAVGKGKALANERTTFSSLPARDIIFRSEDGQYFVRDKIFLRGRRAFQLWVVSQTQEKLGSETVEKFFESFRFVR
jgi:hypothetical protein